MQNGAPIFLDCLGYGSGFKSNKEEAHSFKRDLTLSPDSAVSRQNEPAVAGFIFT